MKLLSVLISSAIFLLHFQFYLYLLLSLSVPVLNISDLSSDSWLTSIKLIIVQVHSLKVLFSLSNFCFFKESSES